MSDEFDKSSIEKSFGVTEEQLEQIYESDDFKSLYTSIEESNARFRDLAPGMKKLALGLCMYGKVDVIPDLWRLLYRRQVMPIDDFLQVDTLGDIAPKIRPQWRNDLLEIFDDGSAINEWVLTGAIGTGKSTISNIAHFYNTYRVTSLLHPQDSMGSMRTKPMNLQLMTVTKTKAESTQLEAMIELLKACSSFAPVRTAKDFNDFMHEDYQHLTPWYVDKRQDGMKIRFPNNVNICAGSQDFHALGEDLFGAALDEAEFRRGHTVERVFSLYAGVTERVDSRFGGMRYVLSTLISSVQTETGVMSSYIRGIDATNPKKKVSSYAIWEIKHPEAMAQDGHFWVMRGTMTHPSKILTEDEGALADGGTFFLPPGCGLLKVPKRHYDKFKFRIEEALKNLAGVYTSGADRPFDDLSNLEKDDLNAEINFLAPLKGGTPLIDQLPQEMFTKTPEGRRLRRFPNAKRYIHCDLADTGEAGVTMCHKEMSTQGQVMYVFDFIGRIVSPNRISFQMVDDFLIDLKKDAEVWMEVLSADQYQSTAFLQKMEISKTASKVKKLSVDRTADPYNVVSNLVSEGAVVTGRCVNLKQQLGNVYIENNKPYAEGNARKDIADSFVGSVYNAVMNATDIPANIYEHYQHIAALREGQVPKGFKQIGNREKERKKDE